MAYSDFDLRKAQRDLDIIILEGNFLDEVPPIAPDQRLRDILEENLPLALARGKGKGRSEWIINPVLMGVRRSLNQQISLFSGDELNVDPSRGLNGYVDFILSRSPRLLVIQAPIVTIVEAKKDDLTGGLGQCSAEMVGAQLFNQNEGNVIDTIYGSVTTGTLWKFLKLEGQTVTVELMEFPLTAVEMVGTILGILVWMARS